MGTDLFGCVEIRKDGVWTMLQDKIFSDPYGQEDTSSFPFDWRSYSLYGFLANIRNYSEVPFVSGPDLRGVPSDISAEASSIFDEAYDTTYVILQELLNFDYNQVFWDRRVMRDGDGAARAQEGEGRHLTIREFLDTLYFQRLKQLRTLGEPENVRIIMAFD